MTLSPIFAAMEVNARPSRPRATAVEVEVIKNMVRAMTRGFF
jgi:hypothetical protein